MEKTLGHVLDKLLVIFCPVPSTALSNVTGLGHNAPVQRRCHVFLCESPADDVDERGAQLLLQLDPRSGIAPSRPAQQLLEKAFSVRHEILLSSPIN